MSTPTLRQHHVQVRGLRIHVTEAGDGPALLLQHGWPEDWRCWERVIPALSERFRVICPDMRGFGASDAPASGYGKESVARDLLGVADALDIERFHLGGHDWGGIAAFIAALRAPERVERLVLLNTAHLFFRLDWRLLVAMRGFWYQPIIALPAIGPWLLQRGGLTRVLSRWADPHLAWDTATEAAYVQTLREPARARASRRLYASFVTRELPAILRGRYRGERLTTPTLFLHGLDDRVVRPDLLRGYEDHADDLQLEFVPGAGHFICQSHPALVSERMLGFLAPALP